MDFNDFRNRAGSRVPAEIEDLAHVVIGAAIEVHRVLGAGLPESCYKNALSHELTLRSIPHVVEAPFDVLYKGHHVGEGRIDLLVDGKLIVELKTVDSLNEIFRSQCITYLTVKNLPLALLINFKVAVLKDGIKRVILSV